MTPKETQWRLSSITVQAGVLAFAMWGVWRTNGSRPCLFVCVATIVTALTDVVWARETTRRTRVRVVENPSEVYVGDPVAIELEIEGPRRTVTVRIAPFAIPDQETVEEVPGRPSYRGVAGARHLYREINVEVVGFGLAGLLSLVRRYTVRLARPLAVGPRPIAADQPFPDLFRSWGDGEPRPSHAGDVVRGVRPYVPGDPAQRIHWRATARTGDLVVKEVDETGAPRLTIALALGEGGRAGERAAGRGAWYALEGLERGYAITVLTTERRQTVRGAVTSAPEVVRRLAAATAPGAPDLAGEAQASAVLLVTPEGDSWR